MIGINLSLFKRDGAGFPVDLNFTQNTLAAQGALFSRASAASFYGSNGLIQSANVDVPRYDYDPLTLVQRGLRLESSRTNTVLWSEDYTNAAWVKTGVSASAANDTAPDGTTTADRLIEDSSVTTTHWARQTVASIATASVFTYSTYLKAGSRTRAALVASGPAFAAGASVEFNLSTGVSGTVAGTIVARGMQNVGNGWWRCWFSFTSTAAGTVDLDLYLGNAAGLWTYTGDATSYLIFWGSQFEANRNFTSYIKTTTVAATRAVDFARTSVSVPQTPWGTYLIGFTSDSYAAAYTPLLHWGSAATYQNALSIYLGEAANINVAEYNIGGTLVRNTAKTGLGLAINTNYKAAVMISPAGTSVTVGGLAVASQGAVADWWTGSGFILTIGRMYGYSINEANASIRQVRYTPRFLTNAELQAITV